MPANHNALVIQGYFPNGPRLPVQRSAKPAAAQPKAPAAAAPATHAAPLPSAVALPNRGGNPLPAPVLQKMEALFKAKFDDVRVHVGPQPAALGALAVTQGSHIYFAPGQYDPNTAQGQRLLGYELAHVVQQRAGRVTNPFGAGVAVVNDPRMEAEAERMSLSAGIVEPRPKTTKR